MGTTFTAEPQKFVPIPEETIVPAKLVELKVETVNYRDKKTGDPASFDKLIWWFEVQSEQYLNPETGKKRKVKGETPTTFEVGRLFHSWAEALLDCEIPIGTPIDIEDLVGLPADITVRHEDDRRDPTKKWERIDQVMPASATADEQVPF